MIRAAEEEILQQQQQQQSLTLIALEINVYNDLPIASKNGRKKVQTEMMDGHRSTTGPDGQPSCY